MNKKLLLSTLFLLALQISNYVVAMPEVEEPAWNDNQSLNESTRSSKLTEWVKDKFFDADNRSDETKAEKLRQAISKGNLDEVKKWSNVIKNTTHIKLASDFAGQKNAREGNKELIEKRNKINNHLKSSLTTLLKGPEETAAHPDTKKSNISESGSSTPREISAVGTPRKTTSEVAAPKTKGNTDLMDAIENGNVIYALNLLADHPDTIADTINAENNKGETALMLAAKKGNVTTLQALLALKGPDGKPVVNVNVQDNDGNTTLMILAEKGDMKALSELLKLKTPDGKSVLVDVNITKGKTKETALGIAAKKGNLAFVDKILTLKPKPEGIKRALDEAIEFVNPNSLTSSEMESIQALLNTRNVQAPEKNSKLGLKLKEINQQASVNNELSRILTDTLEKILKRNNPGFKIESNPRTGDVTNLKDLIKGKPELIAEIKQGNSGFLTKIRELESQNARVSDPELQTLLKEIQLIKPITTKQSNSRR